LSWDLVVYESVVGSCFNLYNCAIFMIDLISLCQVLFMLLVDFWPKFTCSLEAIDWKIEKWHLVVGLLVRTYRCMVSKERLSNWEDSN